MTKAVRLLSAVLSAVMTAGLFAAAPVSAATGSEINIGAGASVADNSGNEAFINDEELLQPVTQTGFEAADKAEAVGAARADLWNCTVTYSGTFVYTGAEIVPSDIVVEHRRTTLTEGRDYTLTFSNNINVGTAKLTVTGIGSYTGTAEREFEIVPRSVSALSVTLKNNTFIYDGKPHNAGVTVKYGKTVLAEGEDYTLEYYDNVRIGTATVTVVGMGNYTGEISKTYIIGRSKSFSDCTVTLGVSSYTYSGAEKKPSVSVRDGSKLLTNGVDYTVTYYDNVCAGTATASVKGRGIYSGTVNKSFDISPKQLSSSCVSLKETQLEYDGTNTPEPFVKDGSKTLKCGSDYTVSYSNNKSAGTVATATIILKGNYSGKISKQYEIVQKPIEKCTFGFLTKTAELGKLNEIKPAVKNGSLLLREGIDYRLSYSTDNAAGTGWIIVQGIGNYTGVYKTEITISAANIKNAEVSVNMASACLYGDGVIRSLIIIKHNGDTLSYNKDYTLSFRTIGTTVTVTVKGIGVYSGAFSFSYYETLTVQNIGDRFVWGRDNWCFDNSSLSFLTDQVDEAVKRTLMTDFKMNPTDKTAVNNALDASEGFSGSCYGMAVSSILSKLGFLSCTPYDTADCDSGTDICNFVQSMYTGTRFAELTRTATLSGYSLETVENKPYTQSDYIKKLEQTLKNNNTVVSLIYRIEYDDSDDEMSHCVVAYGVESYTYTHRFKDGKIKKYDKRILVYDPNFGTCNTITDTACIYYNSKDGSWICPEWTDRTYGGKAVSCYWNAEMGKSLDKGSLSSIIKYHSLTCTEDLMSGSIYDYSLPERSPSVGSDGSTKAEVSFSWAQKPEDGDACVRLIGMGDINSDGSIDIGDATMIQNYLSELATLSEKQLLSADLDGDGAVTVSDVAMLQFYLAELITFR